MALNNTYDGKITWDAVNKKLNVAPGLAVGEYIVALTASNGTTTSATATFKLTVGKTIFTTKYESKFGNWLMFFFLFGFIWMWFVK